LSTLLHHFEGVICWGNGKQIIDCANIGRICWQIYTGTE
jgi:hypothetical protein